MNHRFLTSTGTLAAVVAVAILMSVPAMGQSRSTSAKTTKTYTPPKTSWGDPDLQGLWPATEMINTPLQRPENFGDRTKLTDEEFSQRATNAQKQAEADSEEFLPTNARTTIGPPNYWVERGKPNRQASLGIGPAKW